MWSPTVKFEDNKRRREFQISWKIISPCKFRYFCLFSSAPRIWGMNIFSGVVSSPIPISWGKMSLHGILSSSSERKSFKIIQKFTQSSCQLFFQLKNLKISTLTPSTINIKPQDSLNLASIALIFRKSLEQATTTNPVIKLTDSLRSHFHHEPPHFALVARRVLKKGRQCSFVVIQRYAGMTCEWRRVDGHFLDFLRFFPLSILPASLHTPSQ